MNALSTRKSDKSKRLGMKHYSILRISTITEIQTTQKKIIKPCNVWHDLACEATLVR